MCPVLLTRTLFVVKHEWRRRKIYWAVLIFVSIIPLNYAIKGTGHIGSGLTLIWFMACFFSIIKDALVSVLNRKLMFFMAVFFAILAVIRYRISMDSYDLLAGFYFGFAFLLSVCWMQNYNKQINEAFKKVLHFVAGYSFMLFLTHYSILYFIAANELFSGWAAFIIAFILSNIVATAIAYVSEMRYRSVARALKKYWRSFSSKDNKNSFRAE